MYDMCVCVGDFALVQSLFVPKLRAQHDKHKAALQHAAAASEVSPS
jgi:hypothetical protein